MRHVTQWNELNTLKHQADRLFYMQTFMCGLIFMNTLCNLPNEWKTQLVLSVLFINIFTRRRFKVAHGRRCYVIKAYLYAVYQLLGMVWYQNVQQYFASTEKRGETLGNIDYQWYKGYSN